VVRRIAFVQYAVAAVIAVVTAGIFVAAEKQPEMSPQEYLDRNLGVSAMSFAWLVPLLYVLLALTLVAWVGLRNSSRSRRGRALFLFTAGTVLILLASAFFLIRAVGSEHLLGVGTAATMLGCAMAIVAAGSLLPTVEDWFGGRHELRLIDPLLGELLRRHPDIGIGVRPHGPVAFRVAEKLSLISDALFLEAARANEVRPAARSRTASGDRHLGVVNDVEHGGTPVSEATAIAEWIYAGRDGNPESGDARFPGVESLHQPDSYSDREWIIEIARQYGVLAK
jgi:hypothetical protein